MVASILASERAGKVLARIGAPSPPAHAQAWARAFLDRAEDLYAGDARGLDVTALEHELGEIVGPALMPALVEAANDFSAPDDDQHRLVQWETLLEALAFERDVVTGRDIVPLPGGLRERVLGIVQRVDPADRARLSDEAMRPELIEDEWEWNFAARDGGPDPEVLVGELLGMRRTRRVLRLLREALSGSDRLSLERWANAQYEARYGPDLGPGTEQSLSLDDGGA